MLKELSAENIYIVCGHTDMRKSIDGLAAIVQQQYKLDLFSSSAFLFCGRLRDRLKVLLWEADGFILLYKRLEDGKFNWPRSEQEVRNLTREQYIWLIGKDDMRFCILLQAAVSTLREIKHHFVGFADILYEPDICCTADLIADGIHPFHQIRI